MAKLPKKVAAAADQAETGQFDALPAGPYAARLVEVKTDGEGAAGPYWVWKFEVVTPTEFEGRNLWANTSLSEKALWKIKEMFDAFGYTTDSDTDDLINEVVKLIVVQRPIEKGSRAGQIGNNVDKVLPFDGEDATGDSSEDEF